MTDIISCSLPGKLSRDIEFSMNNKTKEINYKFRRGGKTELNVIFNEGNKLKRLTDSKLGVTYYGFKQGQYSYVINVMNGAEKEEYTMTFDVKKNNKIIQSDYCIPPSFRFNNIKSEFIIDIPYVDFDELIFP